MDALLSMVYALNGMVVQELLFEREIEELAPSRQQGRPGVSGSAAAVDGKAAVSKKNGGGEKGGKGKRAPAVKSEPGLLAHNFVFLGSLMLLGFYFVVDNGFCLFFFLFMCLVQFCVALSLLSC